MYNIDLLANAIVEQAVKDYCNVKMKVLGRGNSKMTEKEERKFNSCVRFFESDWFYELCPNIDGEKLMLMLDQKAKEELEKTQKSKKKQG